MTDAANAARSPGRRGPVAALVIAGALLAASVAALAHTSPPPPEPTAAPGAPPFDLADPARIDAGRKRFNQTCAAYCHGNGGEGGKAPNFKGRPDFVPEAAFETITNGRNSGADVMPPWGTAFSPEQIWELVAYLRQLSTEAPTR
ncbi:c-type cytochrome [Derxia gummosa]|uniref:C-type cytochrome n=1 Tax=Derxia gummosa DSM 723 TaxID=1121388 RepID=A0A8B6X0W0_9BURK|nr:cytochrome c [Derxia gummosa]